MSPSLTYPLATQFLPLEAPMYQLLVYPYRDIPHNTKYKMGMCAYNNKNSSVLCILLYALLSLLICPGDLSIAVATEAFILLSSCRECH